MTSLLSSCFRRAFRVVIKFAYLTGSIWVDAFSVFSFAFASYSLLRNIDSRSRASVFHRVNRPVDSRAEGIRL
jgi:hypothetical protein